MMDYDTFLLSTEKEEQPPKTLPLALKALWWDKKGDWNKSHEFAQEKDKDGGAWVHAYLHRKEGDRFNAGYWYRKAGQPHCQLSLEKEWEQITKALLL